MDHRRRRRHVPRRRHPAREAARVRRRAATRTPGAPVAPVTTATGSTDVAASARAARRAHARALAVARPALPRAHRAQRRVRHAVRRRRGGRAALDRARHRGARGARGRRAHPQHRDRGAVPGAAVARHARPAARRHGCRRSPRGSWRARASSTPSAAGLPIGLRDRRARRRRPRARVRRGALAGGRLGAQLRARRPGARRHLPGRVLDGLLARRDGRAALRHLDRVDVRARAAGRSSPRCSSPRGSARGRSPGPQHVRPDARNP